MSKYVHKHGMLFPNTQALVSIFPWQCSRSERPTNFQSHGLLCLQASGLGCTVMLARRPASATQVSTQASPYKLHSLHASVSFPQRQAFFSANKSSDTAGFS